MKIIFDSAEQKDIFLEMVADKGNVGFCPGHFYLEEYCDGYTKRISCRDCWELAAQLIVAGKGKAYE